MRAKAYIALAILQLQLAITHALPTVPQVEVPQSEGSQSEESQSRKDVVVIDARGYHPQSFPEQGGHDLYTSPGPGDDYYRHPDTSRGRGRVDTTAHNHDALRPDSSVPQIHTIPEHTRWRYTVTTPPNNPYNYVVFTYNYDINHLPTELRFWTDVRMFLNDHWFLRPEVKAALGLRNPPEFAHFHPNTVDDDRYVHFSIVGPKVCNGPNAPRGQVHRQCRTLVDRRRQGGRYWIKDALGNVIAFQPSTYSISRGKSQISKSNSKKLYIVFSRREGREGDVDAAHPIIDHFIKHVRGLGLGDRFTYSIEGYPDPDFDEDDLIVSIVGPQACKGVCTAVVNRNHPELLFSIKSAKGEVIDQSRIREV